MTCLVCGEDCEPDSAFCDACFDDITTRVREGLDDPAVKSLVKDADFEGYCRYRDEQVGRK